MASSKLFSLILVCLVSLVSSTAKPKPIGRARLNRFKPEQLSLLTDSTTTEEPTRFFEVTKPIDLPNTKPCSHTILTNQDFGYTYGKPPLTKQYTPPKHCHSRDFSKIVLEWKATCKGRQFDRIFGVWLAGVELLRSCTAEPIASGIVWSVEKDVTKYFSLLTKNETQTLAVFLGNVVDDTYTGVYHVNLTLHFYPAAEDDDRESRLRRNLGFGFGSPWADLVLPISRSSPGNDGLWFEISDSVPIQSKEFKIPRNAYRAVLEVYVSFHENDEFWYSNLPNEYIYETGVSDSTGNGPFREILVSLDGGEAIGAIWPFPVIYTGGINPLLWRPITGIGSFDLPTYDIEITPFLGKILDGKSHSLGFNVTNALNVWYIDANLHLWLDENRPRTQGKLLQHFNGGLSLSEDYDFQGLDGIFTTSASRRISSVGSVESSFGTVVTRSLQDLSFTNLMSLEDDGASQKVDQNVHYDAAVIFSSVYDIALRYKSEKTFPLFFNSRFVQSPSSDSHDDYFYDTKFSTGFNEDKSMEVGGVEFSKTSLKNEQSGAGYMVVEDNHVTSGMGSIQQVYDFNDGNLCCYFRNISSFNYKIVYDETLDSCGDEEEAELGFSSA